jgi:TRAP-type C4-dicarboxylate transport system permease large subunit
VPIDRAVRTIWPFYLAILFALVIVTFVPEASLILPNLLETTGR